MRKSSRNRAAVSSKKTGSVQLVAWKTVVELLEPRRLLTSISSGQTIAGTIPGAGQSVTYSFKALANNSVTLSVGDTSSTSTYYPKFAVYDPNGNLATNGANYGSDSSITRGFQVPSTGGGTYTVVVNSDNPSGTGTYDLELAVAPATQAPDADGDGGPITSGQTKTGTINQPGDLDIYTFGASASNSVTLSVGDTSSTSTYYPEFAVYDPSGNLVTNGANYGSDSSITRGFQVPSTGGGTYTVVVNSDNPSGTGTYDLELAVAPATQAPDADGDGGPITSGQTKTGTINQPGDLDIYTFGASASNSVTLSVGDTSSTSTYYPEFAVYDPSGNLVTNGANYGSDSSITRGFQVPSTGGGTYTVVVNSDNPSGTGTYDLELAVAPATQAPDADGDGGPITSGQTKTGTINQPGDLDIYTFGASASNSVTLSVGDTSSTSTYYPEFAVYDPNGNLVTNGANYGSDSSVTRGFQVPSTGGGTYTVVVNSDNPSGTGTYDLELAVAPATQAPDADGDGGPITSGQTKTGTINQPGDLDIYTFGASANNAVTVSVGDTSSTSTYYPDFAVYDPNGNLVTNGANYGDNTSVTRNFQVPSTGGGTYTVVVNSDDASGTGTYEISLSGATAPQTKPVVTLDPQSQTVNSGTDVQFTAAASGTPTPTVQWELSTDAGKSFAAITNATSTTLDIGDATAAENGYEYEAVFTNSAGIATTTAATLTVKATTSKPVITLDPQSQSVTSGTNVQFTAAASGTPTPTVQWKLSTNAGKKFTAISGATSTTLDIGDATSAESGYEYEAVFTNSAGTATTTAATLTLKTTTSKPVVTLDPKSQTVTAGTDVKFTAAASGSPTPTVQWYSAAVGSSKFKKISSATSTTLDIGDATTAENGNQYEAIFTNSAGSTTTTIATLTVNPPNKAPVVTTQPKSKFAKGGADVTFTAAASGTPAPTVLWYVELAGTSTFKAISGATFDSLTLDDVTASENGNEYEAIFTNVVGSTKTSAAELTVKS